MKFSRGFSKGQRGFTLVELMVVMGILALLMGIVFPTLTGVKGAGVESQAISDANSTQKAVDRFNAMVIKHPEFPEQNMGTYYKTPATTYTVAIKDKDAVSLYTTWDAFIADYKEIDWDNAADVWSQDGSIVTLHFVPDFLLKEPASTVLQNDEVAVDTQATPAKLYEFLWVLKKSTSTGMEANRVVQVFRLTSFVSSAVTYTQLY